MKSQLPYAILLLFLIIGVFSWLQRQHPILGGILFFGLGFGYVLQRSRFCFVACFRDPFITGNTSLSRALVIALMVATLAFTFLLRAGFEGDIRPAGWHTFIGGIIFGLGMVLAGGCATGTLTRAGEGHVQQWLVLGAFIAGSLWGAHDFGWWDQVFISRSPLVFLPERLGWTFSLFLQALLLGGVYLGLLQVEKRAFGAILALPAQEGGKRKKPPWTIAWPYWLGGILIALLAAGLLAFWGRPWSITTAFTYWGAWIYLLLGGNPEHWYYFTLPENALALKLNFSLEPRTILNMGIMAGALLSSLGASEFRLRFPRHWTLVMLAIAGGLLMGYGARVGMGCNIGAFFNGIASFSLHGYIFGLGLILGSYVGGRLLLLSIERLESLRNT